MLRHAVVGAGHWGPNLIRLFDDRQRSRVAWVVDRDAARLEQVRRRFPDVSVSTEAEEAFADDSVDAVVIATPTSTHHALAREALERGRHVMIEKPITNSLEQGEELCRLAEERGLVLMVGHVFVYNRAIEWVRDYLAAGELGRVYYISAVRTNLGPIRMDVNAAWDLAAHDVSIANYWLGGAPDAVSAVGGAWINGDIEDAVFTTLHFPNGVLVNLHVSWLNPRKARDITVVGQRRMLTVDDLSLTEPVRIYDKGVAEQRTRPEFIDSFASFRASVRDGDITIPRIAQGEPLAAECADFLDCIEQGKRPRVGGPEALDVVRTLQAIERSIAENGALVPVPSLQAGGVAR